jgi:hypothetical protein
MLSWLRLCVWAPISHPHRLWSFYSLVSRSCPKPAVTAVLSAVPAGSCSLLLTPTSNGLGLTPLTFCPHTGRISTNLLAEGLLIAVNLGLAIFSWLRTSMNQANWLLSSLITSVDGQSKLLLSTLLSWVQLWYGQADPTVVSKRIYP